MHTPNNPFKGLWPYGPEDKGALFGRDRDLALVQDRIFSGKTILLFAGSGVGKTSFIRAKLMPEIDPNYVCIYENQWTGIKPLDAIRNRLSAKFDLSQTRGLSLKSCFLLNRTTPHILILDQFEEIFQNHAWEDHFADFVIEISDLINATDLQVRVVFSMREEFLGELSVFDNRIPDPFSNYYRLKYPNKLQATEIIARTCGLARANIDEDRLRILVDDLSRIERTGGRLTQEPKSEPESMEVLRDFVMPPYLQLVCRELWEREMKTNESNVFLEKYRDRSAPAVLQSIFREQLSVLAEHERRLFSLALDFLVTRQGAKMPCELATLAEHMREDPDAIESTLMKLADAPIRILRVSRHPDRSRWFELYHDMYGPVAHEWNLNQQRNRAHEMEYYDWSLQLVKNSELFVLRIVAILEQVLKPGDADIATIIDQLAGSMQGRGRYEDAGYLLRLSIAVRENKLGPEHLDVAASLTRLGLLFQEQEHFSEAEVLLRRALDINEKAKHQLDSPYVYVAGLIKLADLYETMQQPVKAESLYRKALSILTDVTTAGRQDRAECISRLAKLLLYQQRYAEAESVLRTEIEQTFEPGNAWASTLLEDLGEVLEGQGRYFEAEPFYRRALIVQQETLDTESPAAIRNSVKLGGLLQKEGRYAEAESLLRQALKTSEQSFGPDHLSVAHCLNCLASVLDSKGKYAEAESLFRRALAIRQNVAKHDPLDVAASISDLGSLLFHRGQDTEAERLLNEAHATRVSVLGPGHPAVASSLHELASVSQRQGRLRKAEFLILRALDIRKKTLGRDHPDTAISMSRLASILQNQGRNTEAEPLFDRALFNFEKTLGHGHIDVASTLNDAALLMADRRKYTEAEALLWRSLTILESNLDPDHPDLATGLDNLGEILSSQNRSNEAEGAFQRALAIREESLGPRHPDVATSLNNLANLFVRRREYEAAESLFRRAISILEDTLDMNSSHLVVVLENYAYLLDETSRSTEARDILKRSASMVTTSE